MVEPIILFDGVCNLCNGFVNFLIPRDNHSRFHFASLQSAQGQKLLKDHHYSTDSLSTVVLIENGKLYTQSTAVLKILRALGGGWSLFYGFIILPKPARDFFYNLVAKNRYKLFGRRDSCMMPTPELKARFLD